MNKELKQVQEIFPELENEAKYWESSSEDKEIYNENSTLFGDSGFVSIEKTKCGFDFKIDFDVEDIKDFNKILAVLKAIKECE